MRDIPGQPRPSVVTSVYYEQTRDTQRTCIGQGSSGAAGCALPFFQFITIQSLAHGLSMKATTAGTAAEIVRIISLLAGCEIPCCSQSSSDVRLALRLAPPSVARVDRAGAVIAARGVDSRRRRSIVQMERRQRVRELVGHCECRKKTKLALHVRDNATTTRLPGNPLLYYLHAPSLGNSVGYLGLQLVVRQKPALIQVGRGALHAGPESSILLLDL